MMQRHEILRQMRGVLADLYLDQESAATVAKDAGLDPRRIRFNTHALNNWRAILEEAEKKTRVLELLDVALVNYPNNPHLLDVYSDYRACEAAVRRDPRNSPHPGEEIPLQKSLPHHDNDDPAVRQLWRDAERDPELGRLLHAPFLREVIAHLYHTDWSLNGGRLELYRQIVQRLITEPDSNKAMDRFHINDPGGARKREFLKKLTYKQLFSDPVGQAVEQTGFTGDELLQEANLFCGSLVDPYDFVADVIATPLVRDLGYDRYAFAYLRIQEYLAAVELSQRSDCETVVCQSYFNRRLVDLEVLPMTLGLTRNPEALYDAIEQLPDSLTFANLRLRLRGLTYIRTISQEHLRVLCDQVVKFITTSNVEENCYLYPIIHRLSIANSEYRNLIVGRISPLLQENDKRVRARAALVLGDVGDEEAVAALLEALQEEDRDVREQVASALGAIGSPQAIEGLHEAFLRDYGDGWVFRAALNALAKIGGERATEILIQILRDKRLYENIRWPAAEALGAVGGADAIDALLEALKEDEPIVVREQAATALGKLRTNQAVAGLLAALKDQSPGMCRRAAEALGEIGDERAADGLLEVLRTPEGDIDLWVVEALGKIAKERVLAVLLDDLNESNRPGRSDVTAALGILGDKRALDTLLKLLEEDHDATTRAQAARALGRIGDEQAVGALVGALDDRDNEVRKNAAEALGEIGDNKAVESLLRLLQQKKMNDLLRYHAAVSLRQIGDKKAVEGLLSVLETEKGFIREQVIMALGILEDRQAIDSLLDVLRERDKTRDASIAAWALGNIGDARALEGLLGAITSDYAELQQSAVQALEAIDGKASTLELANSLLKALSHDASLVRQKAAQAIGYYSDDQRVGEALQRLAASDPSEDVRTASSSAKT